jgi:hypothetical protein
MNAADERDYRILTYDPFAADRDSGVRVLDDRMLVRRRAGQCCICLQPIIAGERIRARREVCDRKVMTFLFCGPCCEAMAASRYDAGKMIEARTRIGLQTVDSCNGA